MVTTPAPGVSTGLILLCPWHGVLPLLEKGIIDNSLKKVFPGKSVASLALGSKALYKAMDHNPDMVFKDVAWYGVGNAAYANLECGAVGDVLGYMVADGNLVPHRPDLRRQHRHTHL